MNSLETIKEKGFCAGCGLCEAIAGKDQVEMKMSQGGYLRPVIHKPLALVDTQKILKSCPGNQLEDQESLQRHPLWGPLQGVYTGYALDDEIRHQGSSGGVISALAWHLIKSGQVEFVAQIAVSENDPLRNEVQCSRTRSDVLRAAGSRYAPAAPLTSLIQLLETGKKFAYVGKPCDIAALRQYARVDARVGQQIPIMLSFMCAGVPSILGTHAVLKALGFEGVALESFRYRGDGWPGMAKAIAKDGRSATMDYNSSWGNILNRHLQFRCKICPDGTGEFADLVCADAWYGKDGYPDFTEREGRSLILARTSKGKALLESALASSVLSVAALAVDEIAAMQPYQVARKQQVSARLIGTWLRKFTVPKYRHLGLIEAMRTGKLSTWLRTIAGTYKRAHGE